MQRSPVLRPLAAILAALACIGFGWGVRGATAPAAPSPAPAPPVAPRLVRAVPVDVKALALTFDDGPSPRYTPQIIKLLKENGAKATFFVVGKEALRFPNLVKEEAASGFEVANHGDQHLVLPGLSPEKIDAEVRTNEQLITDLTGVKPVLYRLPRGRMDPEVLRQLTRLGYTTVMWSVDTRDYQRRTPQAIASQVLKQARPGSIVILHDGGGNRQPTVDALATILPGLRAEGYQMLTVSQLLELGG